MGIGRNFEGADESVLGFDPERENTYEDKLMHHSCSCVWQEWAMVREYREKALKRRTQQRTAIGSVTLFLVLRDS